MTCVPGAVLDGMYTLSDEMNTDWSSQSLESNGGNTVKTNAIKNISLMPKGKQQRVTREKNEENVTYVEEPGKQMLAALFLACKNRLHSAIRDFSEQNTSVSIQVI